MNLKKLKSDCIKYNEKWAADNKPLQIYECPCCFKPIQTPMPTQKLVSSKGFWDSLTTCYECGKMYFIVKYPVKHLGTPGEILIKTLD